MENSYKHYLGQVFKINSNSDVMLIVCALDVT